MHATDWHALAPSLVREHLATAGPGAVAEIGVWRGELSRRLLEISDVTSLALIDPWVPAYIEHAGRWYLCGPGMNQDEHDTSYAEVCALAGAHGERVRIYRMPSVDGARQIADGSLAVVIIDALHFANTVMEDIQAWLPKLKPNGIMIGDDYSEWYPGVQVGVTSIFGNKHQVLGQTWWTYPYKEAACGVS